MAISDGFKVSLDVGGSVAEGFPLRDGFSFQWAAASNLLAAPDTDFWLNPFNYTLQLRPLQLMSDWATNTTGDYARLRKTDFDVPDYFWEVQPRSAGDYFLLLNNSELITSNRVYAINQPFFISFRSFASVADSFEMAKIGFGDYTLYVYANGELQLTGGSLPSDGKHGRIVHNMHNISFDMVELFIQPMNYRDILIWSPSHSMGLMWSDYNLPDEPGNTITPAAPLKFQFPHCQGIVQASHAIYTESAEFITDAIVLANAPLAGQTLELAETNVWLTPSGTGVVASLLDPGTGLAPVWNGANRKYAVKYELLGGSDPGWNPDARPNWTPFINGASVSAEPVYTVRSNTSVDVTADVMALRLSYGFGKEGIVGMLALRKEDTYTSGDFPHNRLCRIEIGTDTIFLGVARGPKKVNDAADPDLNIVVFQLVSLLRHRAETIPLPSHEAFDGKAITDVVQWMFQLCGAENSTYWDIPDLSGLSFAKSGNANFQKFKPERGDTSSKWFDQIEGKTGYERAEYWDAVAGEWKFALFHPADEPTVSSRTFYTRRGIGATTDDQLILEWDEEGFEPETNQIYIEYCNEYGVPSLLVIDDTDSQDPTKVPASRPKNWLGELRSPGSVKLWDLRKDEDVDRVATALMDRPGVMDAIRIAKASGEFWPDLTDTRAKLVTVVDPDRGSLTYRLYKIDMEIMRDNTAGFYWRPAIYTLERKDV